MSQVDIESRVVVLEKEISSLKSKVASIESDGPWWKSRVGLFADDPSHAEAMKLGREWREKQRPNGSSAE